jgi:uncharacterized delta-60 repeat protein
MYRLLRSLLCATCASASVAAGAANGDPDTGFGTGGLAWLFSPEISYRVTPRVAVQPDGRILVCSATASGFDIRDVVVARFNANGSPDVGFGSSGSTVVDIDGSGDEDACAALVVQPDGRILAAGWTRSPDRMAVLRLTSSGALDATFGGGSGRIALSFGAETTLAEAAGLALQSNGRIVVAGSYQAASGGKVFAVARLLGDGSLDASFALSGRVSIDFDGGATGDAAAHAVAIDTAGRIVLGGHASVGGNVDFAVARLLPNGQPDAGFAGDGRATFAFDLVAAGHDAARALALHGERIVLAGSASQIAGIDMAVMQVLGNGSQDSSFGIDGRTVVPFDLVSGGSDFAEAVLVQPNGKLLVAGSALAGTASDAYMTAAIARLDADGNLDDQFGVFGKAWLAGRDTPLYSGLALQGTRIIACGLGTRADANADFIAALQNDLIFASGLDP